MRTSYIIGIVLFAVVAVVYVMTQGEVMPATSNVADIAKVESPMAEEKALMPVGGGEAMMKKDEMMKAVVAPATVAEPKSAPRVVAPSGGETETVPVMVLAKGVYTPYDPALLANAEKGKVVLFFRASWCPTCKALDGNIRANLSTIPDGVTILDVNYDDSSAMKQKYGVTYQHTMVQVDKSGTLIKKWSGSQTLAAFLAEIQ